MTLCLLCSEPVNPKTAYQRIQGWQVKGATASRKGGSDIVAREPLQEFAHAGCVELHKLGLNVGQESML